MQEKIKKIITNHYGEMLTELEEIIDTDDISLTIEVIGSDFHCHI